LKLAFPEKIIIVERLPVLGTGKADYQKAKAIAEGQASTLPLAASTGSG